MINQIPNLDNLTELEFIYYSVGVLHFMEVKEKQKIKALNGLIKETVEIIKIFLYEINDLKVLILDLDSVTRGIGGAKKPFDLNILPSVKAKNTISSENTQTIPETAEEKEERHKKFFEDLKASFKSPK